ncbi:hypothetical protein [Pikeienuella sp. HZG-20]|uniref:hypothetical protein n=1 Tax=Paludibacillus litoralis TaxID=3133267 RepID=UPI0030ED656D
MGGPERIGDFFIWIGETMAAFRPARAPRRALGVAGEEALLYRFEAGRYAPLRPARAGDAAPLLLSSEQAFAMRLIIDAEAAAHGAGPARLEAARRSPFPLAEADWALSRAPEAWVEGAPWRFAAAPKRRLESLRATLRAAGARPGPAFTLLEGAPLRLAPGGPRAPRAPIWAGAGAALAVAAALLSTSLGATRIEAAAEARLAAAGALLDAAEAEAAAASGLRDAKTAPIRAAAAAKALLAAHPPAAAALAGLSAATPDAAHAVRVSIRPARVVGEFIAPDAAQLAAQLAAAPGFKAARLQGAARAEASGLQRATIELTLAPELR